MLKSNELTLIKDGWRIVVMFWVLVSGGLTILYSWGMADFPAAAKDVSSIKISVVRHISKFDGLVDKVIAMNTKMAVDRQKMKSVHSRLDGIDKNMRVMQTDIKSILQAVAPRN